MKLALILVFFFPCSLIYSQNIALLEKELKNASHDSVRLRVTFYISDYYYGLDQKLAKKIGIESLRYLDSSPNPVLQIRAIQNVANRHWEDGEFNESMSYQKKVLTIASRHHLPAWKGKAYHFIGLSHYHMANYDSTLYYYSLAKKSYAQASDSTSLSKVENHIGLVYDQMGDYPRAIDQILLSMKMQEKLPGFISSAHNVFSASALKDSMFYRLRIEKNKKDFLHAQSIADTFNMGQTMRSIGTDYINLGQYRLAIDHLKKSFTYYAIKHFDPFWENLGEAYEGLQLLDSALHFYQLRLKELQESGARRDLAACLGMIGKLALKQEKYATSLSYYQQSLRHHEAMGTRFLIVQTKLQISQVLEKTNRANEALAYAREALQLALDIGTLPKQATAYESLFRLYKQQGKLEKALEALQLANQLSKKLEEGETRLQVTRLSYLYNTEHKDRQLQVLQEEGLLKEAKLSNQKLQITLAVIVILMVSVLGLLFYSRFRQKKRSGEKLEKQNEIIKQQNEILLGQNREKEVLLKEIHHRVKNNLQVISSIINLKLLHASSETHEVLQQVNNRIFTMGLVHEKLYQKANIQLIRLDQYLDEISRHLLTSFEDKEYPIQLKLECDSIEINADVALACGLICNELLTNSLKYAFKHDQKERVILLKLKKTTHLLEMEVTDNGKNGKSHDHNDNSFGLRFAEQLVISKLSGTWSVKADNGFQVLIQLPMSEQKGIQKSPEHITTDR